MFDTRWAACMFAVVLSLGFTRPTLSADKYVVDPHTTVGVCGQAPDDLQRAWQVP